MLPYQFHPTLVFRSPVYSYRNYSDSFLSIVLKQQFFQMAVYFASEAFYNELERSAFDFDRLSTKAANTARKYFNRMCFRPTPFGLCSGIGTLAWKTGPSNLKLDTSALQPVMKFSFIKSMALANEFLNDTQYLTYRPNTTLYREGNEYRFIKANYESVQAEFTVDSVKGDLFFEKVLSYITRGRQQIDIVSFLMSMTHCTENEARQHIQWLRDNQLISHNLEPNITGSDYLQRVIETCHGMIDETTNQIRQNYDQLKKVSGTDNLNDVAAIKFEKQERIKSSDLYVNLKLRCVNNSLDTSYQNNLTKGLACLDRLNTKQSPAGLDTFIRQFNQKFNGQTVPLMLAMDPETGVGYQDLAVAESDGNIIREIREGISSDMVSTVTWDSVRILLFKKWNAITNKQPIILTDDDLKEIPDKKEVSAPGISVMFRLTGDKVHIESAGGACASALIGRFTPLDPAIRQLACDMATKEAEANPDIIFADIAHICHSHTANIDRRENSYSYEIPILVQSVLDEAYQVPLTDLWVSVVNGEIILQSKLHGKRVIPRLCSAFNYTRNDLAVFRFLCDLQHAGIKTNFNLSLEQLFPGMDYYPRVEYRNTILHLAYWKLKQDVFSIVVNASDEDKPDAFFKVKESLGLPAYIALTQNDHQLIFKTDKKEDILFFLDTIKTQQQVILKEYMCPGDGSDTLADDDGQPYISQYITSLYHSQTVYRPIISPIASKNKQRRKFIAGSEWLYFKIYCHPVRSNQLLTAYLLPVLKDLLNKQKINQWFFIRYEDTGYHIRLRLNVNTGMHQQVMESMKKMATKYVDDGIISNYAIDTYERELERYGHDSIPAFEHVFCASTYLITVFLKQAAIPVTATSLIEFAIVSVSSILTVLEIKGSQLTAFLEGSYQLFFKEFSNTVDLKYQLDTAYRRERTVIEQALRKGDHYYKELKLTKTRDRLTGALLSLDKLDQGKPLHLKEKGARDIIHMHLNRLFINDWRKQEMAVYYFLFKHEKSVQAKH